MARPKGRKERGEQIRVHPNVANLFRSAQETLRKNGIEVDNPQTTKIIYDRYLKDLDIEVDIRFKKKKGGDFVV